MKRSFLEPWVARLVAGPEMRESITDFFAEQFVTREPLARALGITAQAFRPLAEVIVSDAIRERMCFFLHNAQGTALAGVLILRDTAHKTPGDASALCPAALPIHRLLDEVSRPYLEQTPQRPGDTLDLMFLLTDARYEGQGMAWKLGALTGVVALARGYSQAVSSMTNARTQQMWRNFGGAIVHRISAKQRLQPMGVEVDDGGSGVAFGHMRLSAGGLLRGVAVSSARRIRRRAVRRTVAARA